jgi:hypothetical protein
MGLLPVQRTPKKTSMSDLTILLYGVQKAGKSSTCAQAEGALFLATEPGLNHLEVYQIPIASWEDLLAALAEVAKGGHPFKTIVIDTADNAFRFCVEYVCAKNGVKHPSDLPYGKGHSLVNAEFLRVLNKLAQLPYGLILTSHAQEREVEGRNGTYTKTVPTLPDGARKALLGFVDIIAYVAVEAERSPDGTLTHRRVVHFHPNQFFEAGDRSGKLPPTLPLSWEAFTAALTAGQPARTKPNNGK